MNHPDDREIATDVAELSRELFRQATALAAELAAGSGVHPTDARALRLLDALAGAPLSAGRLGQELGLSSAAVTGLLDRLEASGLARRVRDPADRRRVLVELGDTAREFGRVHLQELAQRIERAIGELDHDGLVAVHRFLSVLTSTATETPTA